MSQPFPAAPLDRPTRTMTFACGLLIAVGVPLLAAGEEPLGRAVLMIVGLGILVIGFGFAPRAYEVSGTVLRIHRRLFGSVERTLVGPVGHLPWTMGFGSIRLGGSGGLFGWYGQFFKPGVGRYRAYLTDRSRIVGCPTDQGLVLVSPADPEAFLAAAATPRPGRRTR